MEHITDVAIWNRHGCSCSRSTKFPYCWLCVKIQPAAHPSSFAVTWGVRLRGVGPNAPRMFFIRRRPFEPLRIAMWKCRDIILYLPLHFDPQCVVQALVWVGIPEPPCFTTWFRMEAASDEWEPNRWSPTLSSNGHAPSTSTAVRTNLSDTHASNHVFNVFANDDFDDSSDVPSLAPAVDGEDEKPMVVSSVWQRWLGGEPRSWMDMHAMWQWYLLWRFHLHDLHHPCWQLEVCSKCHT